MSRSIMQKMGKKAKTFLHFIIPSHLSEVEDICRASCNLLKEHNLEDNAFAVDLLLREFINNAILHGNGSDAAKQVCVDVRVGRKWIALSITDEGTGFHWRILKRCIPEPSADSGRGLSIGMLYADRMTFNSTGNRVVLFVEKKQSMTKEEMLHE